MQEQLNTVLYKQGKRPLSQCPKHDVNIIVDPAQIYIICIRVSLCLRDLKYK